MGSGRGDSDERRDGCPAGAGKRGQLLNATLGPKRSTGRG